MIRRCAPAVLLLLAPIVIHGAAAQSCTLVPAGGKQLESERFSLAYRTHPGEIAVGKHFAVEFAVCPKGAVPAPANVRVDAHMPDHRHGMNYQARIIAAPDGRYRAEGLMFHMPGRWELIFDLRAGDKTDRLTHSMLLE